MYIFQFLFFPQRHFTHQVDCLPQSQFTVYIIVHCATTFWQAFNCRWFSDKYYFATSVFQEILFVIDVFLMIYSSVELFLDEINVHCFLIVTMPFEHFCFLGTTALPKHLVKTEKRMKRAKLLCHPIMCENKICTLLVVYFRKTITIVPSNIRLPFLFTHPLL